MSYATEKTPLQRHLDALEATEIEVAKKLSQAAAWLNHGHGYIWSLPDAELTEFLNHLGPAKVNALMTDHYVTGCTINARLDAIASPEAQTRCVVVAGREIVFDGTAFVVIPLPDDGMDAWGRPLPVAEPEPEPEPEPPTE